MRNLVGRLYESGVVEEDDGTWGVLVVLTAKPHQENVSWTKYQLILCMSCRKFNKVTHPFALHIPFFDDAVKDIDTEAKYFISVDMDSGCCKLVTEEEAR